MKIFLPFAVALMIFSALPTFAQRKIKSPDLKIGIGYPYVFGNSIKEQEYHRIAGYPTVSVEKPFPIQHKRENKFSINPGAAYYFFRENEDWGTETVGREYELNHHSLNAYSKFLFHKKLEGRTTAFVYIGTIAGFHILTKTTGRKISYGLNPNNPIIEVSVRGSGNKFFGPIYYGAVAGFQPNAKITNKVKPSFELKFYPGLVKREDRKQNFNNEMVLEASVFLGLHK